MLSLWCNCTGEYWYVNKYFDAGYVQFNAHAQINFDDKYNIFKKPIFSFEYKMLKAHKLFNNKMNERTTDNVMALFSDWVIKCWLSVSKSNGC